MMKMVDGIRENMGTGHRVVSFRRHYHYHYNYFYTQYGSLHLPPRLYIFPLPHLYADIFDDAPHRQLDIDYSHNRLLQKYIKNYIKTILFALFAYFEVYVDGVGAPGSVETKSHSLTLLTFKRVEFT